MLMILTAVFGFAAPFLPELLKFFTRKQEMAQEQQLMMLQIEQQKTLGQLRLDEAAQQADATEAIQLHQPVASFGVQVLDAARGLGWGAWALAPAFYLFTVLDFVAGLVRPAITYAMVGFYMAVKWGMFDAAVTYSTSREQALISIWGEQDWAVLTLVLGFWFGHRSSKATFGGSAMNDRKS